MKVKKVINNNIICAIDRKGNEMIVTGRGLGFQKRTGELIDESKIEKIYRMESKQGQRRLRELVQQIPIENLELTEQLIAEIKKQVSQPLNESLLVTLADHISFAIKRKREGIEFSNPLAGAVMCYYPTEYQLGKRCLELLEQKTGLTLNPDESSFIALHIINAELNTEMSEMYEITKLIDGCIELVEYYYQKTFDRDSLDFSRFVVHLRYFAQRLFQGKSMPDSQAETDVFFRRMIAQSCKKHYRCAQHIEEYVNKTWHKPLTEEELIYLTIHLKRINSRKDRDDAD